MRKIGTLITAMAIAFTAMAESIGLVLSGGGAKGIAHIGVIQALEDNDIPIDYITGTSMGAIIGGLYASGYTPQEMLELIKSDGFANWSTGTINSSLTYYFDQKEPTPAMFHINIESADSSASKTEGTKFSRQFRQLICSIPLCSCRCVPQAQNGNEKRQPWYSN